MQTERYLDSESQIKEHQIEVVQIDQPKDNSQLLFNSLLAKIVNLKEESERYRHLAIEATKEKKLLEKENEALRDYNRSISALPVINPINGIPITDTPIIQVSFQEKQPEKNTSTHTITEEINDELYD